MDHSFHFAKDFKKHFYPQNSNIGEKVDKTLMKDVFYHFLIQSHT